MNSKSQIEPSRCFRSIHSTDRLRGQCSVIDELHQGELSILMQRREDAQVGLELFASSRESVVACTDAALMAILHDANGQF